MDNFLLPLGQVRVGKTKADTSIGTTGPSLNGTDHFADGAKHIGGIHDATKVGITRKARGGQVKVIFDALPSFLGTTQTHALTRRNFHVRDIVTKLLLMMRRSNSRTRRRRSAIVVRGNLGGNGIKNGSGTVLGPTIVVKSGHFGRNGVRIIVGVSLKGNAWFGGWSRKRARR